MRILYLFFLKMGNFFQKKNFFLDFPQPPKIKPRGAVRASQKRHHRYV